MDQSDRKTVALLGFAIPAMEALDKIGRAFVVVAPAAFEPYMKEHGIPYEVWDFEKYNEHSNELAERLAARGVGVAVPLYEECVEWAGALNGYFRDDPRLYTRYLLFRDKGMMKRRAQMHGIRVGVFEEAHSRDQVLRFFDRVNQALAKIEGDADAPVHLKPLSAAGCKGHRFIRERGQIGELRDDEFPCLLETHLDGQEFSCEVFIHERQIAFLNITEYVHLGYSNFVPASPALQAKRERITRAVEDLIAAFDIEYGMIHPEFFITEDGHVAFGEVAARVPGGHIFELIEKAYGFSPYEAFTLCCDPATTRAELEELFPAYDEHDGYAGCLMVYPRQKVVTRVDLPEKLVAEPYFEKQNLFVPANPKVAEREAYGDHYGTIFFRGEDPEHMRTLLLEYEEEDFYTSDPPRTAEYGDS